MKINVTVELDWIEGDYSIDEQIQKQIASHVLNEIRKRNDETIIKSIMKKVNEQISKNIDDIINGWINGEKITITDGYGDKEKSYNNIKELLKERFDNMLFEKVDKYGKTDSYDRNISRLDYFIKEIGKEKLESSIKSNIEDITNQLKIYTQEQIKNKIGNEIYKLAGIETNEKKK
jgi:hypothetical protein